MISETGGCDEMSEDGDTRGKRSSEKKNSKEY